MTGVQKKLTEAILKKERQKYHDSVDLVGVYDRI